MTQTKTYKYKVFYKSRKKGTDGFVSKKTRDILIKNNSCAICGSNKKLEVDHIFPICLGGTSNNDNLRVLCISCNRMLANKVNTFIKHLIKNKLAEKGFSIYFHITKEEIKKKYNIFKPGASDDNSETTQ